MKQNQAATAPAIGQHMPGLAGNDRAGWYVQWQGGLGFRSPMPDRETAVICAAAPALREALRELLTSAERAEGFRHFASCIWYGDKYIATLAEARAALALVEGRAS